jgi:UDP-glucose 4-epimerase
MRIVVTGGSGFIGSHCVDALSEAGHEVTVFDQAAPRHTPMCDYIIGDLSDPIAVSEAVKLSDVVIHAGGMLGTHETVLKAGDAVKINILGTLNVLQATTRYECKLINISKPNVWVNPYSITKDCCEKFCFMYVDEFDAQVAVVKLYNVYGPRQKYNYVRKASGCG